MTQTVTRPTHLAYIVHWGPIHLGFCYACGIWAVGLWLDPSRSGTSLVWRHPFPPSIIVVLTSDRNPGGTLTNFDHELANLVLHEATLLDTCSEAKMAAP